MTGRVTRKRVAASPYDGFLDLDAGAVLEEPAVAHPPDEPQPETLQELAEQTVYGEILLEDLIRRQLVLALSLAAIFLVALFGLPLANMLVPDVVETPVLGLPLGWLLIAVLVYPLLWGLAAYYVSTSKQYEDNFTDLVT